MRSSKGQRLPASARRQLATLVLGLAFWLGGTSGTLAARVAEVDIYVDGKLRLSGHGYDEGRFRPIREYVWCTLAESYDTKIAEDPNFPHRAILEGDIQIRVEGQLVHRMRRLPLEEVPDRSIPDRKEWRIPRHDFGRLFPAPPREEPNPTLAVFTPSTCLLLILVGVLTTCLVRYCRERVEPVLPG